MSTMTFVTINQILVVMETSHYSHDDRGLTSSIAGTCIESCFLILQTYTQLVLHCTKNTEHENDSKGEVILGL